VAHSYGTLISAWALRRYNLEKLANIDNLILAGSPGVGVGTRLIGAPSPPALPIATSLHHWLHFRGGLFALEAPGDPIVSSHFYGARVSDFYDVCKLPVGTVTGHGNYFDPSTTSLQAVVAAIQGRYGIQCR